MKIGIVHDMLSLGLLRLAARTMGALPAFNATACAAVALGVLLLASVAALLPALRAAAVETARVREDGGGVVPGLGAAKTGGERGAGQCRGGRHTGDHRRQHGDDAHDPA